MASDRPQRGESVRSVDGILLLDKPAGMTSNAALQSVRRLFGHVKAGHTGTLDPFATGLLPICLGEATKFAGIGLNADKAYQAGLRLGVATTTGDAEGDPLFAGPVDAALELLPEVLERFRGELDQLPPMFSALKHKGQPLYKYARAGTEIERSARRVRVDRLQVLQASGQELTVEVWCSKGTYIRALAHDIGVALGCGAHVVALRRTRIGDIDIRDAIDLESLGSVPEAHRIRHVRPADLILRGLPAIALDARMAAAILQGRSVTAAPGTPLGTVRVYDADGAFLGVGAVEDSGRVAPRRMCSRRLPGLAPTATAFHLSATPCKA